MRPPLLKQGDRIGIVAPSRVIDKKQMQEAYRVFSSWGLQVEDGSCLYNKHGYFAGTDKERLDDLQQMINDRSIKAIFCARGGYGMTRIIDNLDLSKLHERPKWIIGFSDITALHLRLNQVKVESIHGLMPMQFGNEGVAKSIAGLKQLLFDGSGAISAPTNDFNVLGETQGELIGGNLSLIVESLGTSTEIDTTNKILFMEEIDEYLYKIDRMFNQLKRAKKFDALAGLIIGDFSSMKDTSIPFGTNIFGLISKYLADVPTAFNFPIGHEDYNLAVPISREVRLTVSEKGATIKF